MEVHNIPPVFDSNSRILILGSFPSVKSREAEFFYGHPQNRFWKVISALLECPVPLTVEEKKEMLLGSGIAVWDTIAVCDIVGSSDNSIRNAEPNDLSLIFSSAHISAVYANGAVSFDLYNKFCRSVYGRKIVKLPSTSPANAAYSLDRLIKCWSVIKEHLAK